MDSPDNLSHLPEAVEMAACEWLAKLDRGNLSAKEKTELSEWLKEPLHRTLLTEQINEWSDMDVLSELANLGVGVGKPSWVDSFHSFFDFGKPSLYLTGLMLFILAGVLTFEHNPSIRGLLTNQHVAAYVELGITTSVGEHTAEALPDGSVVHVNTTSVAEVSYTREARKVELKSGEAFFDVAPDSDRPFVVYAGDTSVRAVGTAFAVHLENNGEVRVSVTEGTVEFSSGGVSHLVSADIESSQDAASTVLGNVALYSGDETSFDIQPADKLARQLAWQSGMLEFKGDPLSLIVEEVGRYTNAKIEILDEDIKDVRLGGYFRIGDIESLSSALKLGFNIKVDVVSEELIQISRDTESEA